jgi:hypothetical protein
LSSSLLQKCDGGNAPLAVKYISSLVSGVGETNAYWPVRLRIICKAGDYLAAKHEAEKEQTVVSV